MMGEGAEKELDSEAIPNPEDSSHTPAAITKGLPATMDSIQISIADLGLDPRALLAAGESSLRGIGKTPQELHASFVRELEQEDVDQVGTAAVGISQTPQLKSLRDSHHEVAKRVARGLPSIEISAETGYSISRISILKSDPAFANLVEDYRTLNKQIFIDTTAKMKNVTDDALGVLQDRLVDEPESFTNGMLISVVEKIGDRAGFSPVTKSLSVGVTLSSETISALKAKVQERQHGQVTKIAQTVLDGKYTVVDGPTGEAVSADSGPPIRPTLPTSGDIQETTEAQGNASQGPDV